MAEPAEVLTHHDLSVTTAPHLRVVFPFEDAPEPLAVRVDSLPSYELTRHRAERFIGQVASGEVYIDPAVEDAPNTSLFEAIGRAKEGDPEAATSVRMNAHIAVVEMMLKAGHISQVKMTQTENGNWLQHGQAMLHVHANALVSEAANAHPGLKARTKAETINGHTIEDLGREGVLEDHWVLVPSLFPSHQEVPYEVATKKAGFFGETMTAALQLTSTEMGEGVIQSAFVAGVSKQGSPRHDIQAMRTLYALAGLEAGNMQPLDFLQTPLLIPKDRLPNGIADIVRIVDELGESDTFFGQDVPGQAYETFLEQCQEREKSIASVTDKVVDQLMAHAGELTDPESAIALLAKLIGPYGVEYAIEDASIDSGVFGSESSRYIEAARYYVAHGQAEAARQSILTAKETAIITMCGITISSSGKEEGSEDTLETDSSKEEKDCDYISKECPKCGAKNVKTYETAKEIRGACGCSAKKTPQKK